MARALLENPSPKTAYMRRWRAKNPDYSAVYLKDWRRKQRERVLAHYGGACVCCGEHHFEFLSIDHKNGGGNQHRKELGARGSAMVDWIIREGFPEGFQVMCHNCNQAIGFYGVCPHQLGDE